MPGALLSMNWFEITFTIHLCSILLWLAWSTYTGFEGVRALRAEDVSEFVSFLSNAARRGQAVYMPNAIVALAFGQLATAFGPREFSDPMSVAALGLLVSAIVLGASLVGPQTELLRRHVVATGRDELALSSFWRIFWIHHVKLTALYATAALTVLQVVQ